ncbi:MAG: hypothetical protein ACJ72N_21975 [Labedaea sp.]
MIKRPELVAYAFAAVVVVCATVLAATGHKIDEGFWVLAGSGVGGGAGVSLPKRSP